MIAEELDMRYTTPIPVCIYSRDKSLPSHAVIRFLTDILPVNCPKEQPVVFVHFVLFVDFTTAST